MLPAQPSVCWNLGRRNHPLDPQRTQQLRPVLFEMRAPFPTNFTFTVALLVSSPLYPQCLPCLFLSKAAKGWAVLLLPHPLLSIYFSRKVSTVPCITFGT